MLPERREIATLVVCEDDEPTLELLCQHLTADRFEALPAPSASDALRLCRYKQPDMLLLDLGLPDAARLDVLREIRDTGGVDARFDPRLPVIVLSGSGGDADRVRGLESGADDYLVKPLHYPELRARVDAFAAALLSQRLAGGDLAGLLRRFAVGAAERDRAAEDARAATSQVRFTGLLVVAMPTGGALFAELLQPGFLLKVLGSPISAALLVVAATLQLVGFFAIQRLARVVD